MTVEPIISEMFIDDTTLTFALADGRNISAPLSWFPRLQNASPAQRMKHEICGAGTGVHWPDIDEDISAAGLLRLN